MPPGTRSWWQISSYARDMETRRRRICSPTKSTICAPGSRLQRVAETLAMRSGCSTDCGTSGSRRAMPPRDCGGLAGRSARRRTPHPRSETWGCSTRVSCSGSSGIRLKACASSASCYPGSAKSARPDTFRRRSQISPTCLRRSASSTRHGSLQRRPLQYGVSSEPAPASITPWWDSRWSSFAPVSSARRGSSARKRSPWSRTRQCRRTRADTALLAGESARRCGDRSSARRLLLQALRLSAELGHRATFPRATAGDRRGEHGSCGLCTATQRVGGPAARSGAAAMGSARLRTHDRGAQSDAR